MESAQNTNALANAIAKALHDNHLKDLYCPVDAERRLADHDWVMMRRKKEQERIQFWQALNLHLAKWGLLGVLGFILGVIALGLKHRVIQWLAS